MPSKQKPTIEASFTIQAASGDGGEPVKFKGVGYGGGILRVSGFPNGVVVDLAGLSIPASLPIVADHSVGLDARLGTATATVEAGQLLVAGTIIGGSPGADRAIALLRSGGLSLSIGATPKRIQRIKQGETVEVNGQTFPGPVEVATQSQLTEVSAVGVGADSGAVAIAASRNTQLSKKEIPMSTTTTETPDIITAERERVQQIDAAFHGLTTDDAPRIRATAIAEGWPIEKAQREALELLRASRPRVSGITGTPESRDTLPSSAARLLGASDAAIEAAKLPPAPSHGPRSLLDIAAAALRVEGRDVPQNADRLVRAAFSTDTFAGTLATAISTVGLAGFESADEPAMTIAHRVALPDFKAATLARLNGQFVFKPVAPGGELKHGIISGDTTAIKLQTNGVIVRLTREAVVNDDRQLLAGVPAELGKEAARSIGDALASALSDDGGTFFTSARNNLFSGATSALSVDSLSEAIRRMRTMKDNSNRVLNLGPAYLLVGADLEHTARSIINSNELGTTDGSPRGNPLLHTATVLVDARIEPGQWFLLSGASNAAIVLATLNGATAPVVEALPPEADTLGVGWRAWHDYAIVLHEYRAVIKSLGA